MISDNVGLSTAGHDQCQIHFPFLFLFFDAASLLLLSFLPASANFSSASLAPNPLIERIAPFVLSLRFNAPSFLSQR